MPVFIYRRLFFSHWFAFWLFLFFCFFRSFGGICVFCVMFHVKHYVFYNIFRFCFRFFAFLTCFAAFLFFWRNIISEFVVGHSVPLTASSGIQALMHSSILFFNFFLALLRSPCLFLKNSASFIDVSRETYSKVAFISLKSSFLKLFLRYFDN